MLKIPLDQWQRLAQLIGCWSNLISEFLWRIKTLLLYLHLRINFDCVSPYLTISHLVSTCLTLSQRVSTYLTMSQTVSPCFFRSLCTRSRTWARNADAGRGTLVSPNMTLCWGGIEDEAFTRSCTTQKVMSLDSWGCKIPPFPDCLLSIAS